MSILKNALFFLLILCLLSAAPVQAQTNPYGDNFTVTQSGRSGTSSATAVDNAVAIGKPGSMCAPARARVTRC